MNRLTSVRGGASPGATTSLYGGSGTFYSLAHGRANFDAFSAADGTGGFRICTRAPSLDGQFIVNDPSSWTVDLDTFVKSRAGS